MRVFGMPFKLFGQPFDQPWKRLLLHLVISVVAAIASMPAYYPDFSYIYKITFLIFVGDVTQAFFHILAFYHLQKRYDWMEDTAKRVSWGIFWHTFITLFVFFTVTVACFAIINQFTFTDSFFILLNYWFIPLSIGIVVIVFAVAGEFFRNWKKSLASEEKLKAELMNYKYESLRNQINPHFLLDSFQSLKKLVRSNPWQASEFILKISNLYRHVLEVKDKEFISLKEELTYLQPYIDLLQFRYGKRLNISLDIDPGADDLIPPLSLQFLVENAVENNLKELNDHLVITILVKDDTIIIENSKQPNKNLLEILSEKIEHIRQQYHFYASRPIDLLETPETFTVKLPILKQALHESIDH